MLRSLIGKAYGAAPYAINAATVSAMRFAFGSPLQKALFSSLQMQKISVSKLQLPDSANTSLLQGHCMPGLLLQTKRDVTKFSLNKGKRKTVMAVLKRFKRLDWGCWIRTHCGRHKKLFKKSPALKRRLRQHIFTNASQSWLLDKMVCQFWRRPKHWIDDPYAPYNKRDEFFVTKSKSFKV